MFGRTLYNYFVTVNFYLQTLSALIQGIYKKAAGECNFNVINILVGFDAAEKLVPEMLERCSALLKGIALDLVRRGIVLYNPKTSA
jgi:hypothetical protein